MPFRSLGGNADLPRFPVLRDIPPSREEAGFCSTMVDFLDVLLRDSMLRAGGIEHGEGGFDRCRSVR